MKYKELKKLLETSFTEEQLNQDVTVYVRESDEYYPLSTSGSLCADKNDVLDNNHYYFVI